MLTLSACGSAPVVVAETADSQLAFGVTMAQRQLWNEALFRFRQAAKLDPSNPRIFNNLAVACEATGKFDEALENYQKALRLAPTDKTLKANYTRFVEFYQSFKAKPAEAAEGGEAGEPEAAPEPAEEPAEEGDGR
ncbi:MAG: tetratricopeptide repeat protein [Acidobacteria bacterium]|nr:tetratricopeptide repeat protein [Acidobacteriota bacterium]